MNKPLLIDTCVFGAVKMDRVPEYSRTYGDRVGFEVLAMFDLPEFEGRLREQLDVFARHRITFHGPVFEAEHSAPRGTPAYDRTMYHVRKTLDYARILRPGYMVMHLNNCVVTPERKDEMLRTALENYRELQDLFGPLGCGIVVENTGTILQKNMLLDQREFTDLCRQEHFGVLVDIGHANANGWDLYALTEDLAPQIRGYHLHNNDGAHDSHQRIREGTIDFDPLLEHILRVTPEAELTIEYVRPAMEGPGLHEDIRHVLRKL